MPFLTGNIKLLVYRDSAQTEFPLKKAVDIDEDYQDTTVSEAQETIISLAALGAQTINFNGVGAVKKVYIFSDTSDINVNMNSLGDILYQAGFPGIMPLTVTSMVITNASATLATTVTVILITG